MKNIDIELESFKKALEQESALTDKYYTMFFTAYSKVLDVIDKNTRYYDCGFNKKCVAEVDPRKLRRQIKKAFEDCLTSSQ